MVDFKPDVTWTAPEPLEAPAERPGIVFQPAEVSSKAPKMLPPDFSLEAKKGYGSRGVGGQKYILRAMDAHPAASTARDEGGLTLYGGATFGEESTPDLKALHGALAQALARDGAKRLKKSGVQLTMEGKTQRISLYDLGHLLQQRFYPDLAKTPAPAAAGYSPIDAVEAGSPASEAKKLIASPASEGRTFAEAAFDALPKSEYGTFMADKTQARYHATKFVERLPADAELDKAGLHAQLQRAEEEYLRKFGGKFAKGVKGKSPGEMHALIKSMAGEDLDATSTESLLSMRGRLAAIDGAASKITGLTKRASSELNKAQDRMYRNLGERVLEEKMGPDEDVMPLLTEYGLLNDDDKAGLKSLLVDKLGAEGAQALIDKKGLMGALLEGDVFNEDEINKRINPLYAKLQGELGRAAAKSLVKEKDLIGALREAGIPIDDVLLLREKLAASMDDLPLVVGRKDAERKMSELTTEPESLRKLGKIRMERFLRGTMGQLLDAFVNYGVTLPQDVADQMGALRSKNALGAFNQLSEESKETLTGAFEQLQDAMGRSMLEEYGPFALSKKGRATIEGYEGARAMGKDYSGVKSTAADFFAQVDTTLKARRQAWVEAYARQLQPEGGLGPVVPGIVRG